MSRCIQNIRETKNYDSREQTLRVFWGAGIFFFRFTPRPCFSLRRAILRRFGASVEPEVHIYASTVIYFPWNLHIGFGSSIGEHALVYNLGPISIGSRVTVSQRAHLCAGTHNYLSQKFELEKPPIDVDDDAWICTDAFIGPGVRIGQGAIVGARAAVFKDVAPWTIVGGNPSRVIKSRPHPI